MLHKKQNKERHTPVLSFVILEILLMGCLFADLFCKDPSYMDLANAGKAPCREFFFGTDPLGRDVFACIWHGGRVSLTIGILSVLLSAIVAILYGTASAFAPIWLDRLLMRALDLLLCVPAIFLIFYVKDAVGNNVFAMSAAIGVCSWFSMAKVVRTQVRTIKEEGFVTVSRCMGGGFFHILYWHLAPNFLPSVMFMIIMNVRNAIIEESTLSFLGLGLSLETISLGSMLALADNAFVMCAWWVIVIPGAFLIVLFLCLTEIGNWCRERMNHKLKQL